ncbi:mechanosensitive ion channel [Phyllobacterium sp. 0TCS1.6C]|uniref:mechanosensitive ion channel family protein n=1 Tax=unclassified Phyllobacterium TaxID=2638441 RepID=UPI0022645F71|nr:MULTISPECIES: mechanosensitive ion channel domain-containing protein [unclassified Phyllobacterium]MCX8278961.1 mechanosensitive ion channel [Phyllobacterium sp. 0TCS1.6C]MCX8293745.1 mechanosensitive ion channel [Phyllobacterium sp. 0TCS1.6A]
MTETLEAFLAAYPWIYTLIALSVLVLAALFANFVLKKILLRVVNRFLGRTAYGRDEELRRYGVIERLANIMPAFVIASGIALVPHLPAAAVTVVRNVSNAFIILTLAMALAAALNVVDTIYHRRPEAKLKPIRSYIQIVKIAIYAIAAILMIATLIDRSPLILLSGLGAMAAVLILVFQDTLLSLVAGIQISSTDMVRVGDWIEMPALNADGDVIEIALHTVRVQNWDKTITTIPIRKLVTESFKNWRGMQEAGGRRIKRSIYLDQTSIRFLTQEEIEKLGRFRLLENYLQRKQEELKEWNGKLGDKGSITANTRRITNMGTFRAYVEAYVRAHSQVHQNMTILVRQLQPGPEGLPLEIYCFTKTIAWHDYEAIQSDIFDHLFALLPEFGLSVFQNPSGADFKAWQVKRPALPAPSQGIEA